MLKNGFHLSDQELLLIIDDELSPRRAARAHSHFATCPACRARMEKLEGMMADFTRLCGSDTDSHSASNASSRALLKVRLAELAVASRPRLFPPLLRPAMAGPMMAWVSAVLLIAAAGILAIQGHGRQTEFELPFAKLEHSPVPNRTLTPGATRSVTIAEVCAEHHDQTSPEIPVSVQREIFQEYGMADAQPKDYELDYLVTPELGGSDDPRNLWPEPHSETAWNSYVKDDLENRLHQLVCSGSIDLVTAQHDIATDWVAAYKKYFHTDKPSAMHSGLTSSRYRDRAAEPNRPES